MWLLIIILRIKQKKLSSMWKNQTGGLCGTLHRHIRHGWIWWKDGLQKSQQNEWGEKVGPSVRELEKGIMDFIGNWNKTGKKYVWTKTASQIKTSINEAKERYDHYLKTYKMRNNIILLMRYPILLHCVVKKFLALYFWNRFRWSGHNCSSSFRHWWIYLPLS